jgi:high affinity Mn2+ porin
VTRRRPLFSLLPILAAATLLHAEEAPPAPPEALDWSLHAQSTYQVQTHGSFDSPYEGANSFQDRSETRGSFTATFYAGRRLWTGGEAFVNVELIAGEGLSRVLGLAGPPNGETYRVDSTQLKANLARIFLRQTFDLGGGREGVEDDQNRLRGTVPAQRLVVTLGKVSGTDIFDDNAYAHDARTQFNNWSLWANAAWDYPADTRGYTWGVAVEWIAGPWAARLGAFMEPKEANGLEFDHDVAQAHGDVLEVGHRHALGERPGAVRLLAFWNHARMGVYRDALEASPTDPDVTSTRAPGREKHGFGLNVEQEIVPHVGAFLRAGWNDGKTESWAFTEVERTLTAGVSIDGALWERPADALGVGVGWNGVNADHRDYLAAGGLGFMLGDGALNPGTENVVDAYYRFAPLPFFAVSAEVQRYTNPGFNRDRGPVTVWGLRLHASF